MESSVIEGLDNESSQGSEVTNRHVTLLLVTSRQYGQQFTDMHAPAWMPTKKEFS